MGSVTAVRVAALTLLDVIPSFQRHLSWPLATSRRARPVASGPPRSRSAARLYTAGSPCGAGKRCPQCPRISHADALYPMHLRAVGFAVEDRVGGFADPLTSE